MEFVKILDLKKARKAALDKRILSIKENKDKALSQAKEISDWLGLYKKEMGKPFQAGAKRRDSIYYKITEEEMARENLPISSLGSRVHFDPFMIGMDVNYPEFEESHESVMLVSLDFSKGKPRTCVRSTLSSDYILACMDPDGKVTEIEAEAEYMKKHDWEKKRIKKELARSPEKVGKAKRMLCFFDPNLKNCTPNSSVGEISQKDEDWIAYVDLFYKDIIPALSEKFKDVTMENLDLLSIP